MMNGMKGGFGNLQQLMKQAQKIQQDIETAKKEIANTEITGTAGGGMVEIKMMGNKTLNKVSLKPEVVDSDDVEMLEDLICAAFNDAMEKITALEKEKLPNMPGM